jgi:hypothetical protein
MPVRGWSRNARKDETYVSVSSPECRKNTRMSKISSENVAHLFRNDSNTLKFH